MTTTTTTTTTAKKVNTSMIFLVETSKMRSVEALRGISFESFAFQATALNPVRRSLKFVQRHSSEK